MALVETPRGVLRFHMQAHRAAGLAGLGSQRAKQGRADAAPAELRQDGEIDDADIVWLAQNIQTAGALAAAQHNVKRGFGVIAAIVHTLEFELRLKESGFLPGVPRGVRQFPFACGAVQVHEEGVVFRRFRT